MQVWQGGVQIGDLYRYALIQDGDVWVADAERYTISPSYDPAGECEFRFFIGGGSRPVHLTLLGRGHIEECEADGRHHREPVYAKGTSLEIRDG